MIVIAARRAPHDRDGLAAVHGTIEGDVRNVDGVGVGGVHGDPAEVPGSAGEAVVRIGDRPVLAAVVGDVDAGALGFDERIDAPAIGADGDAAAAPGAFGQTMPDALLPGLPRIEGAVDSAVGTGERRVGAPRSAMGLP